MAIVGAGPAGLMAAERLASAGLAVTVYERMPSAGRKILLAGRSGLNLTHSEQLERLLSRYGDKPPVAQSIRAFPPDSLRAWAEGLGHELFVGSSGRVFPRALKASPLLRSWLRRLDELHVQVRTNHRWVGWDASGALRFHTPTGQFSYGSAATLLALGGASWARLGSDGAWAGLLSEQGVSIEPFAPANCAAPVAWSDDFRRRFAGSPLKRIVAMTGGRVARGEAMITAEGLEGGVVYALSQPIRDAMMRGGAAKIILDLRPDLDTTALARRMGGLGVSQSNALRRAGLSPAAAALVRECGGSPKHVEIDLRTFPSLDRAISTAGGVSLAALDDCMMLRSKPGVFIAGEMLDWEAPTGGYLLQGCFSTGVAAAAGVLRWLNSGGAGRPTSLAA